MPKNKDEWVNIVLKTPDPKKQSPDLPARFAIMGALNGEEAVDNHALEGDNLKPITIEAGNINDAIRRMALKVQVSFEGAPPQEIAIESMSDFSPSKLIRKVDRLRSIQERVDILSELMLKLTNPSQRKELLALAMKIATMVNEDQALSKGGS